MIWGQALKNMGQLGMSAAKGQLGRTAQGAVLGGIAGGIGGASSENTSILGGMAMGAGLGAGMGRYGGAGMRRALLGNRGIGTTRPGIRGAMEGFGKGVTNMAKQDYRGARMLANQGINKIRAMGR